MGYYCPSLKSGWALWEGGQWQSLPPLCLRVHMETVHYAGCWSLHCLTIKVQRCFSLFLTQGTRCRLEKNFFWGVGEVLLCLFILHSGLGKDDGGESDMGEGQRSFELRMGPQNQSIGRIIMRTDLRE